MNDVPEEILEEWDLEKNPAPLVPICDLCGADATDGQSTVDGVVCHECIRKIEQK